ncbi:MAG: radical SAM protein [Candidatus Omnitrophica bacterium]|nr:radical SAM protein [Candidatus Omnitrophota bacterium]
MIRDFLKIRFLGSKIPLAVRWDITARCPWRCRYCQIWKLNKQELDTALIIKIIDEMHKCGVAKISFSGGEPLLREDIDKIIKHTKDKRISPEMNSTGFMFPDKAERLKSLDFLKISLDGSPEVNDFIRGKEGAYRCAIEAAEYAHKHSIRFIFTTTLTGYNLKCIEHVLSLAQKFNTMVAFQPLKDIRYLKHSSLYESNDSKLFPNSKEWKDAIDKIIVFKMKKGGLIRNTLRELKHIYDWPKYKKITCWGGRLFCMINPSGEVSPCDRLYYKDELPNCSQIGFKEAIERLPPLPHCNGCGFCGSLELNYLMSFKWDVIKSVITKKL